MDQFTFKRAKIRSPETWTLTDETLSREGESITLSNITEVMFEVAMAGRVFVNVLKLTTDQKTHSLQCNDSFSGESRQQFLALCSATVSRLAVSGSSAKVRQGKGGAIGGWMMALAGLVLLFGGLFFAYASVANGHIFPNVIFGGGAALIGAFFIKMGEPWKAAPEESLNSLGDRLLNIRLAAGGH